MRAMMIAAAVLLAGCGKPKLSPEAEAVRFTTAEAQVAGCESRGIVRASDSRGGLFGKGMARRAVEAKVRQEAVLLRGNIVLLRTLSNGFWGSSSTGEAFRCAN